MTLEQQIPKEPRSLGQIKLAEIARQRKVNKLKQLMATGQSIDAMIPEPEQGEAPSKRKRAPKAKKARRKLTQASKRKNRG